MRSRSKPRATIRAEQRLIRWQTEPRIECASCQVVAPCCACLDGQHLLHRAEDLVEALLEQGLSSEILTELELWQAQTKQPITELRAANRRAPVGCRRALAVWLSGPAFTLYLPLLARQWGVSVRALEKAKAWIAAGELHRPVRKHRRRDAGGGVS